jgi:uncharacterized membrane protein
MSFARALRHLFATSFTLRRVFDAKGLQSIERAIAESESKHGGEIRIAIEAALSVPELLRGVRPRDQALRAFAELGVWDTEANNGVLIYILWADHDVEIVADRGFNDRVTHEEWEEVCRQMERLLADGRAVEAVIAGVESAGALIARHYPTTDRNELSNRPVLL